MLVLLLKKKMVRQVLGQGQGEHLHSSRVVQVQGSSSRQLFHEDREAPLGWSHTELQEQLGGRRGLAPSPSLLGSAGLRTHNSILHVWPEGKQVARS